LSFGGSLEVIRHLSWSLRHFERFGLLFLGQLVLSLLVVLSQVAVLAHTTGVVRLGWAASGHLGLSSSVVAVVAHVLGVVLLVGVRALVDLSSLSLRELGAFFGLKILSSFRLRILFTVNRSKFVH